jgi:hypothetical protein
MQIDIRPRSFGENLGLVFQLVGRHFLVLLLIQGTLQLPALGLQLWSQSPDIVANESAVLMIGLALMLLSSILGPVATGASIAIVAGSFTGHRATLGDALGIAFRRLFPLLGYAIVVGLLTGIGMMLLLVPGLIVMTIYFVGNCAVVLENAGVGRAMSRSADLTRGRRWNVFAMTLVVGVLAYGVPTMVVGVLFGVTSAVEGEFTQSAGFVPPLVQWLVGVIAALFLIVAPIVIYFSLRAEREGFDVEQLAALVDEIGERAGTSRA